MVDDITNFQFGLQNNTFMEKSKYFRSNVTLNYSNNIG